MTEDKILTGLFEGNPNKGQTNINWYEACNMIKRGASQKNKVNVKVGWICEDNIHTHIYFIYATIHI